MTNHRWDALPKIKVHLEDDTFTYIEQTIKILHQSLRGIYFYLAIKSIRKEPQFNSIASLILISNALMETAVLGWTKIFGSDKEDTYFMKIIDNKVINSDFNEYLSNNNLIGEEFYETLLNKINSSDSKFEKYRDNMKKFRDKFISHTDLVMYRIPKNNEEKQIRDNARLDEYPSLDIAEKSLIWFYNMITEFLQYRGEDNFNCVFQYPDIKEVINFTNEESDELKMLLLGK